MQRSRATVHGTAHWDRATHHGTTVTATGEVILNRGDAADPDATFDPGRATPLPDPLRPRPTVTLDPACHLYRADPAEAFIQRYLLGADNDRLSVLGRLPDWFSMAQAAPHSPGEFQPDGPTTGLRPAAIAADPDGRLWIADTHTDEVLVYDRWSRRVLTRGNVGDHVGDQRRRVLDLAASSVGVFAACDAPAGVTLMRLGRENVERPHPELPVADARPIRVTALGNRVAVLYTTPDPPDPGARRPGWVVVWSRDGAEGPPIPVPDATDVELQDRARDGTNQWSLYVGGRPEGVITEFRFGDGFWPLERQLGARGYAGDSLVALPDGSIAFWTPTGLRRPLPGRGRLGTTGRVTTLALDAREFGARWGRVFVDACLPQGTAIRLHAVTSDDLELPDQSPPSPPPSLPPGPLPSGGPPRIPTHLVPGPHDVTGSVHHRAVGRPEPWSRPPAGDAVTTYEAPVIADPGRYLWLTIELAGTGSATPRVRTVMVERSTHGHLERLPRVFARDDRDAFLDRYLTVLTGVVDDLDATAQRRHVLLDPRSVPQEALPWLASFVGLVLDERWPLPARRQLVAEATRLLSHRGTVWALTRMLTILLGVRPIIVEHFRLRGVGGTRLGSSDTPTSTSIVGGGFRVGSTVDTPRPRRIRTDDTPSTDDRAQRAAHAHRFSVLVPRHLSPDELDTVEHLLDMHRPAHTAYDVCPLGVGMRVGLGLHLGLSSLIGPTGAWDDVWVGRWHLGRDAVLGHVGAPRIPTTITTAERLR